jgi:hypothetical protein
MQKRKMINLYLVLVLSLILKEWSRMHYFVLQNHSKHTTPLYPTITIYGTCSEWHTNTSTLSIKINVRALCFQNGIAEVSVLLEYDAA